MSDVGAPAPEVYRLSMEKLPLAVGRARRLGFVGALAAVTALLALVALAFGSSGLGTDVGLVIWGLSVLLVPYAAWTAGTRIRRRWNAFELSIGPQTLRCAARGYGRVTIRFDEITSLTEGASGLVVRAAAAGLVIRIPTTVEGFLDARARLAARHPIAPRGDAFLWCAALVVSGLLALGSAWIWGRSACLAAAVVATQAATVYAVGVEVRWHPRMTRGAKWTALAVLGVAGALPLCGLALREAFSAL
jgi:hypothetical protein